MKEFHAAREAGVQLTYVDTGDGAYVTVFQEGELHSATNTHPNFDRILNALETTPVDPDEVIALFDVAKDVARRFLSERVAVANGTVYFDGEEVDDTITNQIVRFLAEGNDDFQPLVAFMENVANNPIAHSREQLFDWLRFNDFTITTDGLIVGYKGVHSDGKGGYQSGFRGKAIVDGKEIDGNIPNYVGAVVEMPRGKVQHNPSQGCSTGLHVGTYGYAKSYARGAMLRVFVNPRDVVSVPSDASGQKVRVCRYTVDAIITSEDQRRSLYEQEGCVSCTDESTNAYGGAGAPRW